MPLTETITGAILEGLAVPVIAVDENLKVLAFNALAQQAFAGIENAGGFDDFLARIDGLRELLQATFANGWPATTKIKSKAGYRSEYAVTLKNVGALAAGSSPVVLMSFEDRSLLKDLKTMRTGFVANVSHEIRSPLTAISGFVETLQGPAIEDVVLRRRFLAMMAKEVTRMKNLVSDLLSLSQVEAKERRALKHRVDLHAVIEQAVQSVAGVAEQWGKTLVVQVEGGLAPVMGRQDDLVRVLINLLENAIHYSRKDGRVQMVAKLVPGKSARDLGPDLGVVSIAVTDDGDGIEQQEIPLLTQRFYRVDKSRSRNIGGTGLGLAIVKHILVRHRGELRIESVPGAGATFTILLPVAPRGAALFPPQPDSPELS